MDYNVIYRNNKKIFVAGLMLLLMSCETTFTSSLMMKRDRYGESPVYDMRNGKSVLELEYERDREQNWKDMQAQAQERREEQKRLAAMNKKQPPQPQVVSSYSRENSDADNSSNRSGSEEKSGGWFSSLFE